MRRLDACGLAASRLAAVVAVSLGFVGFVATPALAAEERPGTVERLYVLDCGQGSAPDQSRWSPGVLRLRRR